MMKERLAKALAWTAFLSLLFGVLPLGAIVIGCQLEEVQTEPSLETFTCEGLKDPISEYQNLLSKHEGVLESGEESRAIFEKFEPEKCRIAGSVTAIQWVRGPELGVIFAKLSRPRHTSDSATELSSEASLMLIKNGQCFSLLLDCP